MATVSWGAPTLEFIKLKATTSNGTTTWTDPSVEANWTDDNTKNDGYVKIKGDVLLQNSSQLNTSAGETKTLKNEHGEDVDRKQMPASYDFETSVIKKKGEAIVSTGFSPVNGVVDGDWAMRLTPEDYQTTGFAFYKCAIATDKGWSSDQGALDILRVSGLLPNGPDKEICRDYVAASDPNA